MAEEENQERVNNRASLTKTQDQAVQKFVQHLSNNLQSISPGSLSMFVVLTPTEWRRLDFIKILTIGRVHGEPWCGGGCSTA